MSEQAHTPGPWRLKSHPYEDGTPYFVLTAGDGSYPHGFYLNAIMSEADAHLLVAAPKMLEVLKAARIILKNRDQRPEEAKLLDAIKFIVAKAEGLL